MANLSDSAIKEEIISEDDVEKAKDWFKRREWDKIKERLVIHPFEIDNLGPFTYDLSVGEEALSIREGKKIDVAKEKEVSISPGECVLILTKEYVALPKTVSGLVQIKARIVFQGIVASATKVDPTWYGKLVIALANHSKGILKLGYGEPFCALVLFRLSKPCEKILTRDTTPFLGQESILYRPSNVTPVTMKRPETVTKEDIDEMVDIFGQPFDRVRGMFTLLRKEIVDYVEHEWGPHVLREIEHRATTESFKYLKWLTASIIIAIFILVIGFVVKLFI